MRVGRDYGWKAVAQLAGLLTIEDGDESPETMLADMEERWPRTPGCWRGLGI